MAKSKRGFSFELRNSKQNRAFALKVVEANSGLLRKQKGGEAFSVLLLLAKIAIFALKRR
ncbi:hypothetical protein A0Z30_06810 [Campylobacter upsaliensis]|nr:hypothetical protein [Campylobacter upsaliensis]